MTVPWGLCAARRAGFEFFSHILHVPHPVSVRPQSKRAWEHRGPRQPPQPAPPGPRRPARPPRPRYPRRHPRARPPRPRAPWPPGACAAAPPSPPLAAPVCDIGCMSDDKHQARTTAHLIKSSSLLHNLCLLQSPAAPLRSSFFAPVQPSSAQPSLHMLSVYILTCAADAA